MQNQWDPSTATRRFHDEQKRSRKPLRAGQARRTAPAIVHYACRVRSINEPTTVAVVRALTNVATLSRGLLRIVSGCAMPHGQVFGAIDVVEHVQRMHAQFEVAGAVEGLGEHG